MTPPQYSPEDPDDAPDAPQTQVESVGRSHLRPGYFSRYPRFDLDSTRRMLEAFGEPWENERYENAFRQYNRMRERVATMRILGILALVYFAGVMILYSLPKEDMPAQKQGLWFVLLVAIIVVPIGLVGLISRIPIDDARWRFFRQMGDAIRLIWIADRDNHMTVDVQLILNRLGSAARALLVALQGSRRTWKSPPMVSDRALRLSAPLIDLEMPDDLHLPGARASSSRKHLDGFLRDTAAVVAIEREDLIPRVRQEYCELHRRSDDPETRDRDLTYLSPMRSRSRWDVAKDFWYPLASWLSLFVAAAALVVSIAR